MWSVRSETVSGTQRLRFMNKQDARLCTLEQALLSVGYPISGLLTDSYETGTDSATLNTALFAARVYMAVWRAWLSCSTSQIRSCCSCVGPTVYAIFYVTTSAVIVVHHNTVLRFLHQCRTRRRWPSTGRIPVSGPAMTPTPSIETENEFG